MSRTFCSTSDRVALVDAWRGAACLCMIAYHLLFDLCQFGFVPWVFFDNTPMLFFERAIAYSFILCAGISCRFSRGNIRRAVICAGAGLLVAAGSYLVSAPIRFGILQFLSVAMFLYGLLEKRLRLDYDAVPIACFVLYIAAAWITARVQVNVRWLFWLGLRYDGFVSYDYFPLLPYIFIFAAGIWLGGYIRRHRSARSLTAAMPAALTWTGRHTLVIYLVHQPILYAVCALLY